MAYPSRRGKLAYKILFWFLAISLVPVGFVGYNLVNISQASLQKQTMAMQVSLAVGFADTVSKYVTTFKSVLIETAALEDFAAMNSDKQERYLGHILQVHPAVLELSVIDAQGRETLRLGRYLGENPPKRDVSQEGFFVAALSRGQYVGSLERFQGIYPAVTVAVVIMNQQAQPPRPVGVVAGKISLNGLTTMLSMEFPATGQSQAAVVSPDGFLIAHSIPGEVYRPNARISDDVVKIITTQVSEQGGGEITLSNGQKFLGAYSDAKDLGWIVYVQEPLSTAYQSASQMKSQIARFLVWVVLIIVLLSLVVAGNITQPLRLLREAADRLGKGDFENMPEMIMTNDEIGDLAQTFLTMSESLKEKTGELLNAKQELEKFTKFLEKRVEARTRELKAAQDELIKKERLAAIGEMASVVGHEIRNPLAVINNSIYFIKTKLVTVLEADPKLSKHVKIIESEIQQANGIINEILTYSRTRELKIERVKLNAWLEDLLSVYPFPAHIHLEKSFDPANPAVDIDTTEMQQALRNLIGNGVEVMPAIAATATSPAKGGTIRVRTSMAGPETAMIEVADSGPGIPPDVVDKIFTPFFTTKARGTGLGLAVVRKVVDRHRGRVEVESVVGRGTLFRIFLPIAPAAVKVGA